MKGNDEHLLGTHVKTCMQGAVKSISLDGAVITLENGSDAWLPSGEWSFDSHDWTKNIEAIEIGEEVVVCSIAAPLHNSMHVVSRRQLTEQMIDDGWLNRPNVMRGDELTRMLIRGSIGSITAISEQQPYLDFLARKRLNH